MIWSGITLIFLLGFYLVKINADKELRYLYLKSEMAASDETTIRDYYTKLGREEGLRLGQESGKQKGIDGRD